MEIREFAARVLQDGALEAKLEPPPDDLTDVEPGDGRAPSRPEREARLAIETDPRRKRKVPPAEGFRDPAQRARILHGLANHELQAVELFAWALLRFPAAEASFRRGVLRIIAEEQRHMRLYLDRLAALGAAFGDWPLSGYFWTRARSIATPLEFVGSMCLTFENANLDHALALVSAARAAGDEATAAALRIVHEDEISHVRFGLHWLTRWKRPEQSAAAAWRECLPFPLRAELARGIEFDEQSRRAAGFDDEFVALLASAERPRALYRFAKRKA